MPGVSPIAISSFFKKSAEVVYDPDAQLYFDESTVGLPSTFKSAISWGFEDLKSSGNYSKIDYMIWAAGPNQTLARTNLVNPSQKITEAVSSGYTSNEWFAGNNARYLNFNWNPVDDGTNFVRNNAGFTVFLADGSLQVATGVYRSPNQSVIIIGSPGNSATYAINGDQFSAALKQNGAVHTVVRTGANSSEAFRNGDSVITSALASQAIPTDDWFSLAWNFNGSVDSPLLTKLTCQVIHSGDIDVDALYNTIKGIVARLNGRYEMTELNPSISGMNPMDSCYYGNLTGSLMVVCGGYDPITVSDASDKVWTTPDGVAFTSRTAMPFELAHCLGGVRDDGYLWLWANKQTGEPCCIKMNPADYSWTTVNSNLGGVGESLEGRSFCQWGFVIGNVMYAATVDNIDSSDVQIWTSTDGDTWTYLSDFPTDGNAISCGWYVDGTTVRVAGGCLTTLGVTSNYVENIYESTDLCQTWSLVRSLPASLQSAWPIYFKYNGSEFYSPGRKTTATIYEGGLYRWNGSEWINTLIFDFSGRHAIATTQFNNEQYFINGFLYNDSHKLSTI